MRRTWKSRLRLSVLLLTLCGAICAAGVFLCECPPPDDPANHPPKIYHRCTSTSLAPGVAEFTNDTSRALLVEMGSRACVIEPGYVGRCEGISWGPLTIGSYGKDRVYRRMHSMTDFGRNGHAFLITEKRPPIILAPRPPRPVE